MRLQRPWPSEAREPAQRKHHAEADFQRSVVLHRAAQVDAFDVLLHRVIGHNRDSELFLCRVHAEEEHTEEEREGFAEEGDCEAGG